MTAIREFTLRRAQRVELSIHQSCGRAATMRLSGNLCEPLAVAAIALFVSSTHSAEAAKLEGRNVKIGCLVSLTGKGAEWGQAAKLSMEIAVEEINAKGGIGGRADRADLLRHADARSRSAQAGQPPGRARQGAGDFRAVLQLASSRPSRRSSIAVEDRHQFLLLGQARPVGHEQVGVPQHADQRQAAQAGGRCLAQGIQDQEGRHHL